MPKFASLAVNGPPAAPAAAASSQLYFSPKMNKAGSPKRGSKGVGGTVMKAAQAATRDKVQVALRQQPGPVAGRRGSRGSVTFQQSRQRARSHEHQRLPAISNKGFTKNGGNARKKAPVSKGVAHLRKSALDKLPDNFKFGLGISGTVAPLATESNSLHGPAAYAQLKRACQENDKKALESLLASKMDINMSNKMGSTVLMDTAWDGNLPMCSLLLRHKADCNKTNLRGNTALHFAHERDHKNLIRLLELAGASQTAKNNVGNTPKMVGEMKFVHKHGATELTEAINRCDAATVEELLRKGVNPSSRDISGHTLLMRAVLAPRSSVEIVNLLIDAKADLNSQDQTSQNSALHVAYELNHLKNIDALLAAGAKTWIKNRSGFTAVEWGQHLRFQRMGDLPAKLLTMCEDGTEEQLHEFVEREGTEAISGYDQTGRTPLIIAVSQHNNSMVHALLDVKADVNGKELKGARNGPLHAAYDTGDADIVKLLVDAKADINLRNRKGFTPEEVKIYAAAIKIQAAAKGRLERAQQESVAPKRGALRRSAENIYSDELEIAVIRGAVGAVVRLVNGGANVDARNSGGRTVLMMAVQHNQPAMVKLLLTELDANPDVQDIRGNTALHIACELEFEDCITALEEHGADVYVRNNIGFTGRGLRLQKQKLKDATNARNLTGGRDGTAPTGGPSVGAAAAGGTGGGSGPDGGADAGSVFGTHASASAKAVAERKQHLQKPAARTHNLIGADFAKLINDADVVLAREYIEQGDGTVDVNCLYPRSGDTPLMAAAKNDDTAMCVMLVEQGADPNQQNNRGNSVLHIAHSRENAELVAFLEGLDIMKCSLRNDNGYTAASISQRLQRARKSKEDERRARQVFTYPQDLHDVIVANPGDVRAASKWIVNYEAQTAGNSLTAGTLTRALNAPNAAGDTVLALAVERQDLSLIQLLVQSKADVNVQNRRGNTAMHMAYESAQPHIIMFLLSQGGDLMLKNNVGYTPEQLLERVTKQKAREERKAAAAGKQEAESSRARRFKELSTICHRKQVEVQEVQDWLDGVKAELTADGLHPVDADDAIAAVVNFPNKMSETILFHLVRECGLDSSEGEEGFLGAFKLLLPFANVAVENLRGDTLLHAAYEVEDDNLRTLLLENGADPTVTNNNGFTPADAGRRVAKRREMQVVMHQHDEQDKSHVYSKDLEKAVRSGDLEAARALLMQGTSVNAQNSNGSTVLMDAVWNGNLPMVELLCDSNADPNIANLRRNTALHFAYEKEHTDIAIYIEAHNEMRPSVNGLGRVVGGAKPKAMTEQAVAMQRGREAHTHAKTGDKFSTMLASLIEADDAAGVAAFLAAVRKEAEEKWPKSLVDREDYVSQVLDAQAPRTSATALMLAVQAKSEAVAQLLLENGADPNLQNRRGDTALHFAMRSADGGGGSNGKLAELLFKFQGDGDVRNRMGMTPNDVRARIQRKQTKQRAMESQFDDKAADMINSGDVDGLRARLAEHQAQCGDSWETPPTLNAQNNVGLTLLMVATYDSLLDAMQLLIDAKTDLNVKDRRGETALHIAHEMLASEAVDLLNKAGASKTLTNRVGLTPPEVGRKAARQAAKLRAELALRQTGANTGQFSAELSAACSDGELEAVLDLVRAKADVNAQNKNGSTVLMDAAWNGHAQVVMQLVELKADPEIANLRQNTALHFAYMCEHVDVIEFLESVELASLTAAVAAVGAGGSGDAGGGDAGGADAGRAGPTSGGGGSPSKSSGTGKKKQKPRRSSSSTLKGVQAAAAAASASMSRKYVSPVVKIQARFRGKKARATSASMARQKQQQQVKKKAVAKSKSRRKQVAAPAAATSSTKETAGETQVVPAAAGEDRRRPAAGEDSAAAASDGGNAAVATSQQASP